MYQPNKLIIVKYAYCWTIYRTSEKLEHAEFINNFKRKKDALEFIKLHEA